MYLYSVTQKPEIMCAMIITIVGTTISVMFPSVSDHHQALHLKLEILEFTWPIMQYGTTGKHFCLPQLVIRFYPAAPRWIDLIILSWLVQMLFLHKFLFKNSLFLKRKTYLSPSYVACLDDASWW